MPRIPTYQNQAFPDAGPLATAARGAEFAGRSIAQSWESGFKAIGAGVRGLQQDIEAKRRQEEEFAEQQDIADLTVAWAIKSAQKTVEWKKRVAETGADNPATQEEFMNDLAVEFESIHNEAKTAGGRRFSQKQQAQVWGDLYVSSAADQMSVTAEAAGAKLDTVSASYSAMALADPANWKAAQSQMHIALDAMIASHNIDAKAAVKIRADADGDIARSAAKGMLQSKSIEGIEEAIKAINGPEFVGVLTGEEIAAFNVTAEERKRSIMGDEKALRAEEIRKAKVQADKEAIELLGTIEIDPKTKKATVPGDFFTKVDDWAARNPEAASPSEVMAMKRYANAELKRDDEDVPVNSAVYEDFKKRANAGTLTRTDVLDARARGDLTKDHFEFYMRWVGSDAAESKEIAKLNKYLDGFKGYIIQSVMSLQDTWGEQRWTDFQSDMQEIVPQLRASGMDDKQIKEYIANEIPRYELTSDDEEAAANAILQRGRGMSPYLAPNIDPTSVEDAMKGIIPGRQSLKDASGRVHAANFPKKFFDVVTSDVAEATDKGRGYNETLAYGKLTGGDVELTSMSLRSVLQLQGQMLKHPENYWNSSAVGRYQIVRDTLRRLITKYDLSLDAKFTPELQDFLATKLLEGRLQMAQKNGDTLGQLREEWEGLKNVPDDAILAALEDV